MQNTARILKAMDKLVEVAGHAPGLEVSSVCTYEDINPPQVLGTPSSMVVAYKSDVYNIYTFR